MANLLAARIGGAQIFGAYSLALTTANNVASYAGAGIGTTANRFSGQYSKGTLEYGRLQRGLALVSVQSAFIAAAVLWFTARPLASHLLLNPGLTHLLRLASLSAGAIILLDCMRGFLIGQRRFGALLGLSALWGGGLLFVIPVAAAHGATAMVLAQASVAGIAVAACIAGAGLLGIGIGSEKGPLFGPGAWEIWRFGLVQLASVIGLNAAGWWTASLVTRGDTSMVQMGFYAAATQLRNLIATVPGLVTQSSYALLTEEGGIRYGGPERVLIASTLVATFFSVGLAGIGIATLPWSIGKLYGNAFRPAELAMSLAICTALVHMASSPAASRLTIVSLRLTGIINGVWTVLVIGLATWLIRGAGAVEATSIFLIAHAVSAVLVLIALKRLAELPRGLLSLSMMSLAAVGGFAALAWARFMWPSQTLGLSTAVLVVTPMLLWMALRLASKFAVLPYRRIREFGTALFARSHSEFSQL